MSYPSPDEAVRQRERAVRVRMEIYDSTQSAWIDFTDRVNEDRLISFGGLTMNQEREAGAFEASQSTVVMDNSDGYWSTWPDLIIFEETWKSRRVRFTLITQGGPSAIGIWIIDKMRMTANAGTVQMTLKPLSSILITAQADRVTSGKQWWINKSIGFLVKELLKTRFTAAEVAAFEIEDIAQIDVEPGTSTGGEQFNSVHGRPPETARDYVIYGNPIAVNNDDGDGGYGEVWFGLEEELWKYDPATAEWTYWSKLPSALISAGYKIHHVFVSTTRQKIALLAWVPEFPTTNVPAKRTGTSLPATKNNIALVTVSMTTAPANGTELNPNVTNSLFSGLFCIRKGGVSGGGFPTMGAPLPGSSDANCFGVNMPMPTSHWIRCQDSNVIGPTYPLDDSVRALWNKAAWNSKSDHANDDSMKSRNESVAYWQQEIAGYMAWSDNGIMDTPADYRFSIGQYAGSWTFREASDEVVGFSVAYDSGLGRYTAQFIKWNIQSGAYTTTGYYCMTGNEHYLPTSIEFNFAANKLLVTGVYWAETAWSAGAPVDTGNNEPVGGILMEVTWPLAAGAYTGQPAQSLWFLTTNYTSSDAKNRRRWLPLQGVYASENDGFSHCYAGITFMDYSAVGAAPWGFCMLQRHTGTGVVVFAAPYYSTGRISGAYRERDGATMDSGTTVYMHDAGRNAIIRHGSNTVGMTVGDVDPPVDGDTGLTAGLVWSLRDEMFFGISAAGIATEHDPDVSNPYQIGKMFLFQSSDQKITARVELADFTGLSVWEALGELAAMADFVYGFDEVGTFFFRRRELDPDILGTITALPKGVLPGYVQASELAVEWGHDEVFNYVEIEPSRVILKEPEGTVRLLARPSGWNRDPWNGEVTVMQKSLTKQQLVLRCVSGAILGDLDAGIVRKTSTGLTPVLRAPGGGETRSRLRFAWVIHDRMIETSLLTLWNSAAAGDTGLTIVVPYLAAIDVHDARDALSAEGTTAIADWGDVVEIADHVSPIKSVVHNPTAGTTTIIMEESYTGDQAPQFPAGTKVVLRSFENNGWSNGPHGVTKTVASVAAAGAEGDFKTFTVLSTRHLEVGVVVQIGEASATGPAPEYVVTQIVDGITFIGRRFGVHDSTVAIADNSSVRAFIAPCINDEFPTNARFWVGGTGIGLQFQVPEDADEGVFLRTTESPFMVGDEIHVTCAGLVLENMAHAKQIAADKDSILKYGIIEYRAARRSRFLNYELARQNTHRLLRLYAWPRFKAEADLPGTMIPRLDAGWLIEDHRVLRRNVYLESNANGDDPPVLPDTETAIAFRVRGFTIDPVQGRLKLITRAVNPHIF